MSCPTCDHTMQGVGLAHWCPRCGTLVDKRGFAEAPGLVYRCRQLEPAILAGTLRYDWHQVGIREAINTPDRRPPV